MSEPCCPQNARGAHCDCIPCRACVEGKRRDAIKRMVKRLLSVLALVVIGSIGVVIGKLPGFVQRRDGVIGVALLKEQNALAEKRHGAREGLVVRALRESAHGRGGDQHCHGPHRRRM